MFTAKRMIVTKRSAALAAILLSHVSAASSDAKARHVEAPRLGSNERQRQHVTNFTVTIINTTNIATAASASSAAINTPINRQFKVLTAVELASKKLTSSSYAQLPVERPASHVNKRSNSTSSVGSLICHSNGSSCSVGSCLLGVSKKDRYDQGLKCMLKHRVKGRLTRTGQSYKRSQS